LNLPDLSAVLHGASALTGAALVGGIAALVGFGLHLALFALFDRIARASSGENDNLLVDNLRQPARWSLMAVAISVAAQSYPLLDRMWSQVAQFAVPALLGWTALRLVTTFAAILENRAELSQDVQAARSRKTRIAILSRTAAFVVVVITVALMLFSIPAVRSIGVTLMASAGLAGLAVGAAAQPALKSLIAGIQIAITEPFRIGDLVVIDGETGRVEEIRISYVVLRTGDERRVVVPATRFLDVTFQNWTRVNGGLTGTVIIPVVPFPDLAPLREAYLTALAAHPDWDKRTGSIQVGEARVGSVELRLLMSAEGPTALDRLRTAMREAMLDWLRQNSRESLCTSP